MDKETLSELLTRLHEDLGRNPALGERDRQLLLEVQGDIEHLVAHSPAAEADAARLRQSEGRVREALVGFEGSHPQLASTLERMLVVISNAGL